MRFLFLFLFIPIFIFGDQDDWGDVADLEVINIEYNDKQSFSEYWDKHFFGFVAGTYSQGTNHSRNASEFKLGFSEHFNNFKVVLEGSYRRNSILTKYDLVQGVSIIESDDAFLNYSSVSIRQAFFDFYPIKNLTISVGKQLNVWGQMDVFSPVDFFLPIDFSPMGFSLNKADNRLPQNTAKLLYYPIPNLEIGAYFFPTFEENDLYKSLNFSSYFTTYKNQKYYMQKVIPTGRDEISSAGRITWYSSFLTTSMTYYDGFNHALPVFRKKYIGEDGGDHFYQNEYGYYSKRGVGLELSVPAGKLNFKAEATLAEDFSQIDASQLDDQQLVDAINLYNDGYDTVPVYRAIYSVGIDSNSEDWFYNFYLISVRYYKNPQMNSFWNAYESIYGAYQFGGIPIFPSINIGRYLGENKKGTFGIALGYFTGSMGLFIYTSNEFNESLSWAFSVDAGISSSELSLYMNSFDSNAFSSGEYRQYKFIEPKVTYGMRYKL